MRREEQNLDPCHSEALDENLFQPFWGHFSENYSNFGWKNENFSTGLKVEVKPNSRIKKLLGFYFISGLIICQGVYLVILMEEFSFYGVKSTPRFN